MADDAEESPAQRQARLRREKRNAKLQSEGADRLARINQMTGRTAPADEAIPRPAARTNDHDIADPAEVDISEHHWTPQSISARTPRNDQGAMQAFGPMPPMGDSPPDMQNDPMMQMMQQLMGGGNGSFDPSSAGQEMPPMFEAMQAMMGNKSAASPGAQTPSASSTAHIWRIVHAVFALGLAAYIALSSSFNGSKASRYEIDYQGPRLIYLFGTLELLLQTSRFFMEQGQISGGGWLATVLNLGVIPEPWAGYIRLIARYSIIWRTIVADAMTVVFVLGTVAWWRGTDAIAL